MRDRRRKYRADTAALRSESHLCVAPTLMRWQRYVEYLEASQGKVLINNCEKKKHQANFGSDLLRSNDCVKRKWPLVSRSTATQKDTSN